MTQLGWPGTAQIVPLKGPAAAQPVAAAQLTYRGGPLLGAVKVTTIFWGAWWKQAPQSALVTQLNKFFDDILVSALIDQLAEYSMPNMPIGHGTRVASTTIDAAPPTSADDSAIQSFLQGLLGTGSIPKADANSLYIIYLPSGTTVTLSGQTSCQAFCGYHDVTGSGVYYGVEPYPDCSGCLGGLSAFDALCLTSSHELCEAVTDPVPGQGWYDDANGEIGDICAWQTKTVDGYTVQLEWSNSAGACR
jgi:hypothetical protein